MSYILYLVDKDWGSGEKPDGGGLQLYPLETEGVPGVPAYAPSKTIPPRWNQMVLFAVQPGVSFHDVQEVRVHILDHSLDREQVFQQVFHGTRGGGGCLGGGGEGCYACLE